MARARWLVLSALLLVPLFPSAASAQLYGPLTMRLAPYCNVITFTAIGQGPFFNLSGFDDNCGASPRFAVSGSLFPNPSFATLGGGLSLVAAGRASQISLSIVTVPLSGTWSDNAGNSGTLVFGVAAGTGPPRPLADQAPRVARACSTTSVSVTNATTTTQTLVSATIQAPGPGHVVAFFDGTFYKASGAVGAALQVEIGLGLNSTAFPSATPPSSRLFVFQQATGTAFVDVRTETTSDVQAVSAGTHVVNALIRRNTASGTASIASFGPQCLTLMFVERNGMGTLP